MQPPQLLLKMLVLQPPQLLLKMLFLSRITPQKIHPKWVLPPNAATTAASQDAGSTTTATASQALCLAPNKNSEGKW
jgi:hypothetical protein